MTLLRWMKQRDVLIFCCFKIIYISFEKNFKKLLLLNKFFYILKIENKFQKQKTNSPKTLPSLIVHAFHLYE